MRVHWRQSTVINDYSNQIGLCVSAASSIGIGVFLIVGYVAKHVAGPATVLSVLIAASIGVLTGLFYAELSQRLPRKASPYTFSNVCIGRLAAFLTGWTLILEYVVAVAVVAKGIGLYLDTLIDEVMETALTEAVPIPATVFGDYFDFFGFTLILLVGFVFLIDLRRYHLVDNAALALSLATIIFVITTGAFNANPVNWSMNPDPAHTEPSGFAPFGVLAIFKGAAMFSFVFIAVESLIRPRTHQSTRSCGLTGLLNFAILLASVIGCTVVLTLMWPHNLMHKQIPFPHAFADHNMVFAKWTVSIVAILILSTSLWTLMFPLKRQILALAEDGLLPFPAHNRRALGITLLTMVALSSLLSGLFSMGQLIDLLSVGTLLMFIVIAVAIVMLRFSHQLDIGSMTTTNAGDFRPGLAAHASITSTASTDNNNNPKFNKDALWTCVRQMAVCGNEVRPSSSSFWVVKIVLIVEMGAMLGVALLIRYAENNIYQLDVWALVCIGVFAGLALVCCAIIAGQPMRTNAYYFAVPLVTVLSMVSMFVCILLVVMLDYSAWVRFVVWVAAGVPVYVLAIRRGREQSPSWRTGGISKIQGLQNCAFVADTTEEYTIATAMSAMKADRQMVEIRQSDEQSQLDTYIVGAPPETRDVGATMIGAAVPAGALVISQSRTPSPSSSLDDIMLASDVIENLSERKEPNGKVYFVDEIKSVKSAQDLQQKEDEAIVEERNESPTEVSQQTVAVIHLQNATELDSQSINTTSTYDHDSPENTLIEGETKTVEPIDESTSKETIVQTIAQEPILTQPDRVHADKDSPIDENMTEEEILSSRSNNLPEGLQPTTAVLPSLAAPSFIIIPPNQTDEKTPQMTQTTDPPLTPILHKSHHAENLDTLADPSNNAVVNYEQHLKNQDTDSDEESQPAASMFYINESNTDTEESQDSPATSPDPDASSKSFKDRLSMFLVQNRPSETPKSPITPLDDTPSLSDIKRALQNSSAHHDQLPTDRSLELSRLSFVQTPRIDNARVPPPPPVFNETLYNTVRSKSPRPPTPDYDLDPPVIRKYVAGPRNVDDVVPGSPVLSFRDKLENILNRELSIRSSMRDASGSVRVVSSLKNREISADRDGDKLGDNQIDEPRATKTDAKGLHIETIQRALFKDVLKSINPTSTPQDSEERPPSRRSSHKPVTIEDARNQLRHVEGVEL